MGMRVAVSARLRENLVTFVTGDMSASSTKVAVRYFPAIIPSPPRSLSPNAQQDFLKSQALHNWDRPLIITAALPSPLLQRSFANIAYVKVYRRDICSRMLRSMFITLNPN